MRYHDITTDDMKNGDGLRTVLWVSGCNHHCEGCHNPVTWDPGDGLPFTIFTMHEVLIDVSRDYISGLTISGGDPLLPDNIKVVESICKRFKNEYPHKTLWIYTGYRWEDIYDELCVTKILKYTDVLVDGKFVKFLSDPNYRWAGSTNQRVIDVQRSLKEGKVILHESN